MTYCMLAYLSFCLSSNLWQQSVALSRTCIDVAHYLMWNFLWSLHGSWWTKQWALRIWSMCCCWYRLHFFLKRWAVSVGVGYGNYFLLVVLLYMQNKCWKSSLRSLVAVYIKPHEAQIFLGTVLYCTVGITSVVVLWLYCHRKLCPSICLKVSAHQSWNVAVTCCCLINVVRWTAYKPIMGFN